MFASFTIQLISASIDRLFVEIQFYTFLYYNYCLLQT
jgi:hypothetical protein